MNETTKTNSRRRLPFPLLLWLIFFLLIVVVMTIIGLTTNAPRKPPYPLMVLLISVVGASLLLAICYLPRAAWRFIRWLGCWRNFRRFLVALAIFATLVAIFYTEEDWRGKRAW